ncbi:hypothetical protein GCM10010442_19050 [Kitasatospora kifunensis]
MTMIIVAMPMEMPRADRAARAFRVRMPSSPRPRTSAGANRTGLVRFATDFAADLAPGFAADLAPGFAADLAPDLCVPPPCVPPPCVPPP